MKPNTMPSRTGREVSPRILETVPENWLRARPTSICQNSIYLGHEDGGSVVGGGAYLVVLADADARRHRGVHDDKYRIVP